MKGAEALGGDDLTEKTKEPEMRDKVGALNADSALKSNDERTETLNRDASLAKSMGAPSMMTGQTQPGKLAKSMTETGALGDTFRASMTVKAKAESNIHGESTMKVVESREDLQE